MLSRIAARYDVYLIDMWGTVYDRGAGLYAKAAACLAQLKRAGKCVILTSNAARPAASELSRQLGAAARELPHDHLVTAGEVIRGMARGGEGPVARLGRRYYTLGHERNRGLLADLGFEEAGHPRDAAFIVVAGLAGSDDATSHDHPVFRRSRELLAGALERRTPLFVAKSDWLTVFPDGAPWIGPGPLVEWYAQRGGPVHVVGKPAPAYYEHCASRFPPGWRAVLAIGDHRATDIEGGARCGYDTLLVRSGIESRIAALAQLERGEPGAPPTYETEVLEW